MKKAIKVIIWLLIILFLIFGTLFVIDKYRMDHNLPVVFSTWGYDYAPPVNHENITEKIPNISGENLSVSIPLKEKEDLLINLFAGWTYESANEEPERYEYVIAFYSPSGEKKMSLRAYKDMFGVCGTGLEVKDITLDIGNTASVGYYDGSERWSFVNFGDNVVMHSESYLTPEEANEALSMIKTMKFVKTLPGNIAAIEDLEYELGVVESKVNEAKKILNNKDLHDSNTEFDLYYYGLKEVNVKVDNKEMTLEDALRSGYITLEGMLKRVRQDAEQTAEKINMQESETKVKLTAVEIYRDGGTIEASYDDGGTTEWMNSKYTIIKCRRLDGNKDMYICKFGTTLNDLDL